jgi:hypothetical protein
MQGNYTVLLGEYRKETMNISAADGVTKSVWRRAKSPVMGNITLIGMDSLSSTKYQSYYLTVGSGSTD